MRVLILGATGLLGQALVRESRRRGLPVVGAARRGTKSLIDVTDAKAVADIIERADATLVVNATSFGGIEECAADPEGAFRVNAHANGVLAEICKGRSCRFVAISTDHYFTGDGAAKHPETASVHLLNDYAASKYAGECLALAHPESLIVRTNVTGFRGWAGRATFAEWVVGALRRKGPMTLFDDYYCSTIDADACAGGILDLAKTGATGLINLACRDVASKADFIERLARRLGLPLDGARRGSVRTLPIPRAESAGLDVSVAERRLGRLLPGVADVIEALAAASARHDMTRVSQA